PASVNGVVGLRPTMGLISTCGVVPLAWSLDTVGPMTRTVHDCAVLTQVLAGYDPRDVISSDHGVPYYSSGLCRELDGVRIAMVTNFIGNRSQPQVKRALADAQGKLKDLGVQFSEVYIQELDYSLDAQFIIESSEASAYHQRWLRTRCEDYGEDVRLLLEAGELYLATHYIQAQRFRRVLRSEFLRVLETVDALLTPTLPFIAPKLGETKIQLEQGCEMDMLSAITTCTAAASLTGLPALTVPCGFDENGVPVGMQLIGRPYGEQMLFRIGHLYQTATDFHKKVPPLTSCMANGGAS
ncbi:MAG: Asp-tRNA(Asn)/Glu-tRNA(Gln) amidotransferase GatCAB subunit A, partial [Alicyclobacillus sp.]|nr:Asp-tRNA(Asn)/Glu-tRNA(Gln) amidotransferase GatCAB subunit A [Alicyclobacillus sp.]